MPTPWVATLQDLYRRLPASACVSDARQLAGVNATTNKLDLPGHGYADGDLVSFAARTGSTLDSAINGETEYAVAVLNSRFFRLVGVTLNGDGVGLPFAIDNVESRIRAILADRTSYVIACAIAYRGPWYTPPVWAPGLVADLAAPIVANVLRIESARYDVEAIKAGASAAQKVIDMLLAGALLADGIGPIDADDGTPDDAARAGNAGGAVTLWTTGTL